MATNLLSHKLSKVDKQAMLDSSRKERANSWATFFYWILHMDTTVFADKLKKNYQSD